MQVRERPFSNLANASRRAHGVNNIGLSHLVSPLGLLFSQVYAHVSVNPAVTSGYAGQLFLGLFGTVQFVFH
jgi:hypothetical protein